MKKLLFYKTVFICLTTFAVALFAANAVEEKLDFVLKNMRSAESEISDLEIDYREEILYLADSSRQTIEGNLKFLKPGKFFISQKTPQEQKIYINSNAVTVYTPSNKQALIDNWSNQTNSEFTPASAVNFAHSWRDMSKTHSLTFIKEDKGVYILALSPNNKIWTMSIYISKENFRPSRMIVKSNSYTIDISLFNYKINQNTNKKIFDFSPPKGVEVIKLN
ncbi:MAG: outer-membrane lipoprotein carrier protein LolA [Elusimicrobiota bacterium]|nr:outer-membrane lipoprotein carrier protein LolA [Elusimicrobiota bacterium]